MATTDKEEAALREVLAEREARLARMLREGASAYDIQKLREKIERTREELSS